MDKITTADQWRDKKGTINLELPSGVVIRVKENKSASLMMANVLPLPLFTALLEKDKSKKALETEKEKHENRLHYVKAMKLYLPIISDFVIEPRIIVEGSAQNGEINFWQIPDTDKDFIFRYMIGGEVAASLESFRPVGPGPGPGEDGPTVRKEAV